MGKLINRIPGSRLLISSLSGSAKQLDIKRHSPNILYIYSAEREMDILWSVAIFMLSTFHTMSGVRDAFYSCTMSPAVTSGQSPTPYHICFTLGY